MPKTLTRRSFIRNATAGAAALAVPLMSSCGSPETPQPAAKKPNIVFILIDDMGWRDLACFGSKFFVSPNIDKLATQGMTFTDAYSSAPICSPTRASLMTGKYPARLHVTDWIKGFDFPKAKLKIPDWTKQLNLDELTLAEALKTAGYATANIGKWHLGDEGMYPEDQGFDLNLAGYHAGLPPSYFYPYENPEAYFGNTHIPNLPGGEEGEYLTDRLTDEALKFMESNRDNPFFLYLSHYAVHTPLQAKQEMINEAEGRADHTFEQRNPIYAAMIKSVDDGVGRIMAKIDEMGIGDDTVFIFTSDNGGLLAFDKWPHVTSNLPLRGGKGTEYEGGVRIPQIIRWPSVVEPGSVCDTPVISNDFFPTLLDIAGIDSSIYTVDDGVSMMPLIEQSGDLGREAIYWHFPHYNPVGAKPYSSIRKGDFKLILNYEYSSHELYNLRDDIGERTNLASKMPEKTTELRTMLDTWLRKVDAQIPVANPNYDGGESPGKWILAE